MRATRTLIGGVGLAFALAAFALAGCAFLAKTVKYERGGNFDMPDVTGLTPGQAKVKIATSGIVGSVSVVDNYTCDDEGVQVDHVCYTSPRKGNTTSARIPITLYLRPKPTSMEMPNLVGKSEQDARDILTGYGFKRIEVTVLRDEQVPDDCKPRTVCETSPPAGQQAGFNVVKVIYVAPATKKVKPVKPEKPRDPERDRTDHDDDDDHDGDDDDGPGRPKDPEKPKQPEKPKEDPAEPIF